MQKTLNMIKRISKKHKFFNFVQKLTDIESFTAQLNTFMVRKFQELL